jgi:hypothetical protein
MLSPTPDSPSDATRLRDCPARQPSYLSTRDRGAGQTAALLLQRKRLWLVVIGLLAAVLAAATSIYDLANIKGVVDGSGVATVGWGLWLDAVGSVSAVLALLVLARAKLAIQSQPENPPVLDLDTTATEIGSDG